MRARASRFDLSDLAARRALFDRLGTAARHALVVSEGLIYLSSDDVRLLARDLSAIATFERWTLDCVSPALLTMMQKRVGRMMADAGAP